MRWVTGFVLATTVACSSSTHASAPSRVTEALNAFDHAVTAPQRLVRTSPTGNGPALGAVVKYSADVRHLRDLDNPSCGGIGSQSVYAVTGDPNALWKRMRTVRDGAWAETKFHGRRVRLVEASGYDYDITATMLDPTDHHPALVVVLSCS